MVKINCPKCNTENYFSLAQSAYEGPFRCVKCKEIFTIRIENDELKSCQLISQQEVNKLQLGKHY